MSTARSKARGRMDMTDECGTGGAPGKAPGKARAPGPALVLLVALAAAAADEPAAPAWPPFLEPRGAFPEAVVVAVERVWREPTLARPGRPRPTPVPFALFAALVDAPEVTAAAARHRARARWQVRALGDGRWEAEDGDGARGRYRVLRRDERRRIILSSGEHSSFLLGTITGSALTVLDLEPREDGVAQSLSAWVRIDNPVAAFLARVLITLFGGVADRKLAAGLRVTAATASGRRSPPAGPRPLIARPDRLPDERRIAATASSSASGRARPTARPGSSLLPRRACAARQRAQRGQDSVHRRVVPDRPRAVEPREPPGRVEDRDAREPPPVARHPPPGRAPPPRAPVARIRRGIECGPPADAAETERLVEGARRVHEAGERQG